MKLIYKILIAILVIYLLGVGFFSIFTYPETYVNGNKIGVSLKDNAFESYEDNPTITIYGRNNKSALLNGSDIAYTQILIPGQTIEQNSLLWPLAIFKDHNYSPKYEASYDKNLFDEFLAQSELMTNMLPPTDAYIQKEDGELSVVPEEEGDTLDKEAAEETIITALENGDSEVVLNDEYLSPDLTADSPELKERVESVGDVSEMKIEFDMGDATEVLTGSELTNIYDTSGENLAPFRDRAYEYVRQLAIEYDTYAEDQERPFTTSTGEDIVVVGGIYGWLMDVDATTDDLMELLKDQKSGEIVPTYLVEGLTRGKDDIGETYIEVSIDKQHLWYYKDGKLITETDVVTGDPTRNVPTHKGVGKVWSKEQDRSLVGIVPQSSADYNSFVDFWMPINWNDEGIHNSTWRTDFGGNIFRGNGSYGCINLPYEPTEKIFENVEINTPVVVY